MGPQMNKKYSPVSFSARIAAPCLHETSENSKRDNASVNADCPALRNK
jgi:hypothetical protein